MAFSGSYVGTVIALPISGLLAEHVGWEMIFYVFGAIGIVWCIAWAWVVKVRKVWRKKSNLHQGGHKESNIREAK